MSDLVEAVDKTKQRLSDLKDRLAGGDTKLSARDLAAARDDIEFAELRGQAEARRKEAAAAQARAEAVAGLRDRLGALDAAAMDAVRDLFAASLDAYLRAIETHNEELEAIRAGLGAAGGREGDVYGPERLTFDLRQGHTSRRGVRIGAVAREDTPLKEAIEGLVENALRQRYPRGL